MALSGLYVFSLCAENTKYSACQCTIIWQAEQTGLPQRWYTTHPRTSIRVLTLMSLCVRHRKTRYPAFSWKWHWRSISLTHLAWQTEKCEAIGFVLSLLRLRDIWSHALLSQKRDATQCKCSAIKAVLIYLEAEEMKCNYNIIVKWDEYRTRRKCWSREVWSLISFPNYKMSFGWIWT